MRRGVLTLQEKQRLAKQQTSKVLLTKSHELSPFWRITSPFNPLLIFSFVLHLEKFHLQRFVAWDRSRTVE